MNNEIQKLDISLLDMNKESINSMVESYMTQVNDGEIDPLKAFIFSQKLLEFATQINSKLKEEIKGIKGEFHGLKISEVKAGSKFDYSGCGSQKLGQWNYQLNALKELIKGEETFLKSLKEPLEVVNTETGETYEVRPPVNTYSISVKIEWL